MDKQFKAGQVWKTRDGYEATVKQVTNIGDFPIWMKIERLDESFAVRADGTGRSNSDDLVALLHDTEVAA